MLDEKAFVDLLSFVLFEPEAVHIRMNDLSQLLVILYSPSYYRMFTTWNASVTPWEELSNSLYMLYKIVQGTFNTFDGTLYMASRIILSFAKKIKLTGSMRRVCISHTDMFVFLSKQQRVKLREKHECLLLSMGFSVECSLAYFILAT